MTEYRLSLNIIILIKNVKVLHSGPPLTYSEEHNNAEHGQ